MRSGRITPALALLLALCVAPGPAPAAGSAEDPTQRVEQLRREIAHHDELYFRHAAPEITDFEYDLLKRELRQLEREAGIEATAADQSIGDDRDPAQGRVAHARPMLSLDKAYSSAEVAAFLARVEAADRPERDQPVRFSVEPKFDGVAISVVLENGRMVRAVTRGNGEAGEDVSAQIAAIRSFGYEPALFEEATPIESIELRGEVYLTNAAFARLNAARAAAGDPIFRHPRNVAAASIKLDDLAEVADRGLSIVFHGWGDVRPAAAEFSSVAAFQRWLEARGFPAVTDAWFVDSTDPTIIEAAIDRVRARAAAYPTDGVVIKVDDVALQRELGDGPTAPRWALARKFAPLRVETVLRAVTWQVGRTGVLTPVAEFDAVEVGGTRIARATLHNAAELSRRDLHLGDTIVVEKAGEVVPAIVGVDPARRPVGAVAVAVPLACPACASVLDPSSDPLVCGNVDCPAQLAQQLAFFASREAVGIRGLGTALAEKLVAAGLVRSPADLYGLSVDELTTLPGVGPTSAQRLVAAIAGSRQAELWRMVAGIGLPDVGPASAKAIAARISSLNELLNDTTRAAALQDVGDAVRASVEASLTVARTRDTIARLHSARVAD